MATDETNESGPGPEDLTAGAAGEWAEALVDQKAAGDSAQDMSGGVLSGDSGRPMHGAAGASDSPVNDIKMVLDIPVQLSVELGRTRVSIKHILQLGQGSVVELDALAGEPMDVLVNGYLIAQGEVVVVNDKFGIRLTDVVTPSERLRRINKG
jgi:flagellar motor switch protein FliN/FliY